MARRPVGLEKSAEPVPVGVPVDSTDYLSKLVLGIDAAITEARALVETKRRELDEAERNLALYEGIKGLHAGTVSLVAKVPEGSSKRLRAASGGGTGRARSERQGSVSEAVLGLLREAGELTKAELRERLGVGSDKAKETQLSNALQNMKTAGKVVHDKTRGVYAVG